MDRLSRYIYKTHFNALFVFFLPLFFIASLIFFIRIVSLTSIIQLSFFELFLLYLFILPQILFFTLPIVYFLGGVSALYRLSYEYELVALFALGVSPKQLTKLFFKTSLLLFLILLSYSLILIPQAKQLYKGFIIKKKAEAKLNIKPSEFGHKFGNWFLYIEKKDKQGTFFNTSLYSSTSTTQNLIIAKRAHIANTPQGLQLLLIQGRAFTYNNKKLKEISFDRMHIYDTSTNLFFAYKNPLDYWSYTIYKKKGAFDITLFILFSAFPLISIFFLIAIGIKNPRFDRSNIFLISLSIIIIYFGVCYLLAKAVTFYALLILPLWMIIGFLYYKKTILSRY